MYFLENRFKFVAEMSNNVELCKQSAMQGVSLAVQLDSDGKVMVCFSKFRKSRRCADPGI